MSNNKIFVYMAAYNGERYIHKQIVSIISQLSSEDELIIVNDCSTDTTLNVIQQIQDSRIKVIENDFNIDPIFSFEKAIKLSSGDIVFLSDQDDIWFPEKVVKIQSKFEEHPEVTLVLSDAYIIDEKDHITDESFFAIRGAFKPDPLSNIIKSKYHGCTIAFKKEMLNFYLPFPKDIPMHDIWIGIVNSIYGKAFYIDEPLIKHRRHSSNTGRGMLNSAGLIQMLLWRLIIVKNIFFLVLIHTFSKGK